MSRGPRTRSRAIGSFRSRKDCNNRVFSLAKRPFFVMSHDTRSGQVSSKKYIYNNVNHMSNCTNALPWRFRNKDVFSLNVEYSDAKSVDDMCIPCDMSDVPNEVYVSNLSKRAIVNALEDKHMFDKLDRKSKHLYCL